MDLLARREHSEFELLNKVSRRFPGGEALIQGELEKLRDEGLQNDSRMAESFVRARIGKGQGPVKIRADLRSHGIPDSVIKSALEQAAVDWEDLAREVSARRFGESGPRDVRERARRIRFLQQRGFLFDQIRWLR
jgi:regulatory protein